MPSIPFGSIPLEYFDLSLQSLLAAYTIRGNA